MQTVYIPLENGPQLGPRMLYPVVINVGWFTIQWRVQPYTAHVIAVQLNMANQAWIPNKPVIQRRLVTRHQSMT